MSKRITQKQLESYLWGAAVLLRGYIDAGDYKQFIFPLLFWKRICDIYDEEYQKALDESDGDIEFAEFAENHRFQIPDRARWEVARKKSSNIGKAIQSALRAIEKENPALFGVFGDAPWTNKDRLSDETLKNLIEHFSKYTLSITNLPEDELGNGYEYLIKKFADDSGHTAAEFYTNRTVVHLMTEMLEPAPGESVYDPTCGSGGMLLSCISYLKHKKKEYRNVRLYGQERNLMTSAIAKMNLYLHGIEDFEIVRDDTLSNPAFVQGDKLQQFDICLANPPYSIKQWNRKLFSKDPWGRNIYGTPPQGRADYAFWQHIVKSLKPVTGRCGILFPHGVLFRNEEQEMREKLIRSDIVECVLGLGPNLFYNSPMEACIVICRTQKKRGRKRRILFINAVEEVTRNQGQSYLEDNHINRIVKAYKNFKDVEDFAKVASIDQIKANSYNLSIPLYVKPKINRHSETNTKVDLNRVIADWRKSSDELHKSMNELFEMLETFDKSEKPAKTKKVQPAFVRTVLAAEITSQLYNEPTFGSVKQEKILFLCEKHLGLEDKLQRHYYRQAAGPYDPKTKRSIESNFKKQKWFNVSRSNGKRVTYTPLENFGNHKKYYDRYFSDFHEDIQKFIDLFKRARTEQCEIVATLYSAWKDFLDNGQNPTDKQIVDEVLNHWHEEKKKISPDRWHKAIDWMKEKRLTPVILKE